MILSIDPGSEQSAYVLLNNDYQILAFGKDDNHKILSILDAEYKTIVIEMIASYGMPVGAEVFETCAWLS